MLMSMNPLLAILGTLVLAGCTSTPVHRAPSHAEMDTDLKARIAERDERETEIEAKQAKARGEYDRWLADQFGTRFLELNPEVSEATKRAILAGELLIGMTRQEAWAAVGPMLPQSDSDGVGGKWTVWKTTEGLPIYLHFRNDRLARWQKL